MIQRAQLELRLIMISDAAIGVGVNHAARTAALDYLRGGHSSSAASQANFERAAGN